jgi:hypothetical protein
MSGATAKTSVDLVNQDLRAGATRALALLGTLAALHAAAVALYLPQLEAPARWSALGASLVLATMVIVGTWGALRTLRTRLTEEGLVVEGLSETTSIRWSDVVRLRRDSGRIMLERIGAPALVIPLWFVCRPDELHSALRGLVPNRALQRGGA